MRRRVIRGLVLPIAAMFGVALIASGAPTAAAAGTGINVYFYQWPGDFVYDPDSWPSNTTEYPPTGYCDASFGGNINFHWDGGDEDGPCGGNFFYTYAHGQIIAPYTGTVDFCAWSDDGVRLVIDDVEVLKNWDLFGADYCNATGSVEMVEGQSYDFKLWHFENEGGQGLEIAWRYGLIEPWLTVPQGNFSGGTAPESGSDSRLDYPSATWSCVSGIPTPSAPGVEGYWQKVSTTPLVWGLTLNSGVFADGSPTLTYQAPIGVCGDSATAGGPPTALGVNTGLEDDGSLPFLALGLLVTAVGVLMSSRRTH